MTRRLLLPALVATATALFAVTASAGEVKGIHDARYCEIIALKGLPPTGVATVYNTIAFNRCPARWWDALTTGGLAKELHATVVVKNGPRHFLMDVAKGQAFGTRTFHGQKLSKVAQIHIRTAADLVQTPYVDRTIARTNTWTWKKGRTLYELVKPNGRRYVMQSYAQIKDPKLTLAKLRKLGPRLKLPARWHYRSVKLHHRFVLAAKGSATITQDDLQNTDQLVPKAKKKK